MATVPAEREETKPTIRSDIAVIGMACRVPGCNTYEDFWELLRDRRSSVSEIPLERWSWREHFGDPLEDGNKTNARWAGCIDDVDAFDAHFFGISPASAEVIDPQQRIMLELCWACMEDAGIVPSQLAGARVGVYLAAFNYDYKELLNGTARNIEASEATGTASAVIANRVSHFFDFTGPSALTDAACSGSLQSIHDAVQSLWLGESSLALAGGVNLLLTPTRHISFSKAGMLSPTGACRSFDAAADGYVRSEGAGVLLLKPLAAALRDGDSIHGVIKGTAVNHAGRTHTLTYPSSAAQARVIRAAQRRAAIDPATISFVEAHGTGTAKGDPIEIEGLKLAFADAYRGEASCAIGSAKSNLGHLEAAAGVAGVIKVLLSMQHQTLPGLVGFSSLNPRISLAGTPFRIAAETGSWEPLRDGQGNALPRRAGVSSFGFGGTNAHVVLEEAPSSGEAGTSESSPSREYLFCLSARSVESVMAQQKRLARWLSRHPEARLLDVSATLLLRREHFQHRVAFVARDRAELLERLAAGVEPVRAPNNSLQSPGDEAGTSGDAASLARAYLAGARPDFASLFAGTDARHLRLPTYAFERQRFWLPAEKQTLSEPDTARAAHPLLHERTGEASLEFRSAFSGRDPWLADHRIQNRRVLPGAAYLEMARAAAERASGAAKNAYGWRLRNVVWLRPLEADVGNLVVRVALTPGEQGTFGFSFFADADPTPASTGEVEPLGVASPTRLDPNPRWNDPSATAIEGERLYAEFLARGVDYGPSHQAIVGLRIAPSGEVLARLSLPEMVRGTSELSWVLHPSMIDAACQAALAAAVRAFKDGPVVAFSIESVEVHAPSPLEGWALVRPRPATAGAPSHAVYDIELFDEQGLLAVRLQGLALRATTKAAAATAELRGATLLAPTWEVVPPAGPATFAPERRVLIIGGTDEQQARIRDHHPTAVSLTLNPGDGEEAIAARLDALGKLEQVFWLAPAEATETLSSEHVIAAQRGGVLACFSVIKALLRLGYAERPLAWTAVTEHTQRVYAEDPVSATHAAVPGLVGTLAREVPGWTVRALDVERGAAWPVADSSRLPLGAGVFAYRRGEWFRQSLVPVEALPVASPPYRNGGVYVIVGGAGGIGSAWTEALIREHGARVIWIGRRGEDAELRERLDRLGELGPRPTYLTADAGDLASLRAAYRTIKARHGAIHGVILSAMVMRGQPLGEMSAQVFESALRAKVHTSACCAEVFAEEPLDFLLFFSSINAFECSANQANYAAACTFQDAFALQLGRHSRCAVKVINWGYWGSVGALAGVPAFQAWREREGIGSIELPEAMAAAAGLLESELPQVALVKTTTASAALTHESTSETLRVHLPRSKSVVTEIRRRLEARERGVLLQARGGLVLRDADALVCRRLWGELSRAGLFDNADFTVQALTSRGLSGSYARWMEQSLALFEETGFVRRASERGEAHYVLTEAGRAELHASAAWWESATSSFRQDPDTRAQLRLLDATLAEVAAVVTGRRRATEVIFPGSSLGLVEGIYRDNAVADYFNDRVAEVVRELLLTRDESPVRILEIGAGTGGTTARVLPAFSGLDGKVEEYCYTDVSTAFLRHGEEAYGSRYPYLRSHRFDVEQELSDQGLESGRYDVVIATNVLHATRRVREAVRHAKAALAPHGLLVLNELSSSSVFTHVTFGLLEGWWRAEDGAVRLPGCPGLSPDGWRNVLESEGLRSIFFPVAEAHRLGQQIIVAESDGIVRLHRARPATSELKRMESASSEISTASVPRRDAPIDDALLRASAARISELIREVVGAALRCDPASLDPDEAFADYGVDSITAVSLVRKLSKRLGIELRTTSVFDYSSIHKLAEYVARETTAREEVKPSLPSAPSGERSEAPIAKRHEAPEPSDIDDDLIAIVGMSGRFAQSRSLDELWDHLKAGRDLVTKVSRWDLARALRELGPGSYCDHGGLLDGIDEFDAAFFGITPREAAYMDPQQRLFLQEAWRALEDAGCQGERLEERRVSIHVGCQTGDYEKLFDGSQPAQAFWGNHASVIPARIAYHLNLKGPAIAVDTACSSSLVAIHLACQGLRQRESDVALAGGVFVLSTPDFYVKANRARMLSPRGRCFTFDDRADGFVPAEGVGAVVLKRLRDALRDGDHIRAVIRGSGINQDGTTNGITAPSAASQQRLAREVFDRYGIDPGRIGMVEAHGTGTSLGDPIEYDALKSVFSAYTSKRDYCALGSIKTNLGHAAAAAGMAGLFKVVLSLEHGQIPASLHFLRGNPHIDFTNSPFFVNTALRPWPKDSETPRCAAISAFGFSGTNACLVLEEAPLRARKAHVQSVHLFALSALNPEQLTRQVDALVARCDRDERIDPGDVSYTLLTGRKHLPERLAVVARDVAELCSALRQWRERGTAEGVIASHAMPRRARQPALARFGQETLARCRDPKVAAACREDLATVAELWVQGYDFNFVPLFDGSQRSTVSLPTYPFASDRHWAPGAPPPVRASVAEPEQRLHPLLHRRVGGAENVCFESHLTGSEFVLSQHRVRNVPIFAGTAHLELVRAALSASSPDRASASAVRLTNVVWTSPLALADGGPVRVRVELGAGTGARTWFRVASASEADAKADVDARTHCKGDIALVEATREAARDLDIERARCHRLELDGSRSREAFQSVGIDHGPSFSGLRALRIGGARGGATPAFASLALDDADAYTAQGFVIHPGMLDSALQAAVCVIASGADGAHDWVPFAVDEVEVRGPTERQMAACIVVQTTIHGVPRVTLDLCDLSGDIRVRIIGLTFRKLSRSQGRPTDAATARASERYETLLGERRWSPELSPAVSTTGATSRAIFVCGLPQDEVAHPSVSHVRAFSSAGRPLAEAYPQAAVRLLETIQAVARPGQPASIQLVTPFTGEDSLYAGLFGMLKSAAREYPSLNVQLVEVEHGRVADLGARLAADAARPDLERVRYEGGSRLVARWRVEAPPPELSAMPLWKSRGVYLITGGGGGIAESLVEDIVSTVSEATIILVGRSRLDPARAQRLDRFRRQGVRLDYHQCDVADRAAVVEFVRALEIEHGTLSGVLHLAGVRADGFIARKSSAEVERVMAPKVTGTLNLDHATRQMNLDFFVLFSSISAELGNAGQADYAAANGFLQAYARHRNELVASGHRRGRTVSIAWPLWKTGGMQVDERVGARLRRELGIVPMESSDGMNALRAAWASRASEVLVVHGVRSECERVLSADRGDANGSRVTDDARPKTSDVSRFDRDEVLRLLVEAAATVCSVPATEIDPDAPLEDYGFDRGLRHALVGELTRRQLVVPLERCLAQTSLVGWAEALLHGAQAPESVPQPARITEARAPTPAARPHAPSATPAASVASQSMRLVRTVIANITQLAPDALDSETSFYELGIDSLMAIDLTTELEKTFGSLPKTLFFECRNIDELSAYLAEHHAERLSRDEAVSSEVGERTLPGHRAERTVRLESDSNDEPTRPVSTPNAVVPTAPQDLPAVVTSSSDAPLEIAIVGVAGRYPRARNLAEFWNNLCRGEDCITEIPKERWDHAPYFDPARPKAGKTYSKWGGFIEGVDEFDPLFFNISPRDAEYMDPQERLFLQCAYETLEDAGYAPRGRSSALGLGRRVGVYVGVMYQEYQLYGAEETQKGRPMALSGSASSIANRVSYCFDFTGPSMAVDSMCSASLSALHLACQAIRNGDCDVALAGGVNVSIHPNKYLMLAQGNYASSKGRCESFGRGGDGYVPGEGVGAVLLKPLARAIADHDHIYGIVRATAINHGGKTSGYTVPNPNAQAQVILDALSRARVDARHIGYVEAHGTGTSLGDPIEVAGLQKAFRAHTTETRFCALGSVKSNIGHCESAAGVAGLTKILLQLRHGKLVPSLHSEIPNPNIDFDSSPFRLQRALADWPRQQVERDGIVSEAPRLSALSSFGAGGSNAHAIVEEYVSAARVRERQGPSLIVLSARNEEQLRELVARYLDAIRRERWTDADLPSIAFTLQVGRDVMSVRLACVAATVDELALKLRAYLDGAKGQVHAGTVRRNGATVAAAADEQSAARVAEWLAEEKYDELLEHWVRGGEVDWTQLYAGRFPMRVALPTYPFARERYWFSPRSPASSTVSRVESEAPRPDAVALRCEFTGNDRFFADHVVRGQRILPGAVCLDLVRTTLRGSTGAAVQFTKVTWLRPIVAGAGAVHVGITIHDRQDGAMDFAVREGEDRPSDEAVRARGTLALASQPSPPRLDREAILRDMRQERSYGEFDGRTLYARLEEMGVDYGPTLRSIVALHVAGNRVLAQLQLTVDAGSLNGNDWTDSRVLDAAFQAVAAIAPDSRRLLLPFACREVTLFAKCRSAMWVALTASRAADGNLDVDLDVCDAEGQVCIRVRGFRVRESVADKEGLEGPLRLVPVWSRAEQPASATPWPDRKSIVVIGASRADLSAIESVFPNGRVTALDGGLAPERLSAALAATLPFDHVVWVAPRSDSSPDAGDEALIAAQEQGVLSCFRLVKALHGLGLADKSLRLTFLTAGARPVFDGEEIDPAQASVHGFVGALANERTTWSCLLADAELGSPWPWRELFALPPDAASGFAHRGGSWYREELVPCESTRRESYAYRRGGVYVVIGGAGGVGSAWSEMMLQRYQAQVVWIGRRPMDDSLRARLDRLAKLGPRPLYLQADATNRQDLERARDVIRERYGRVHGLVHSAIVLRDRSIANMSEDEFLDGLSAKVDVSVRLAQVFDAEPLDFVLFFSSMISFTRNAGQCNYAAGCTFKDAFAYHLGRRWSCPVKLINWGYFGTVGIVAGDRYQERMRRAGIDSIEPAEANEVIGELLASPLRRLGFIKTTSPLGPPQVRPSETVTVLATTQGVTHQVRQRVEGLRLQHDAHVRALLARRREVDGVLDPLVCQRAWGELLSARLFEGDSFTVGELEGRGLSRKYASWMEQSLAVFEERGYVRREERGDRWTVTAAGRAEQGLSPDQWARATARFRQDADTSAHVRLMDATLGELAAIVTGRRRATDVMFPASSLKLVEGVYRDNPVADYFNDRVADVVREFVRARGGPVRLLEIGAGTGGTTARVLPALSGDESRIEEYCYTDVSNAFLMHGQEAYGRKYRFLKVQRFDVEQAPAGQGIAAGRYDLVLATNVLHATRRIREAVRHAKAVLANNGLLVLNEVSERSVFSHMTFGLLDGWWLSEDAALRLRGNPGLSGESWQRVLEGEGFRAVFFPAANAHGLGQQLIVSESDGVARVSRAAEARRAAVQPAIERAPELPAAPSKVVPPPQPQVAATEVQRLDPQERTRVRDVISQFLSEALKVEPHLIDPSVPFADYGLDSITGVNLVRLLNEALEIDLDTTTLFDHSSVHQLADFIVTRYRLGGRAEDANSAPQPQKQAPSPEPVAPAAPQVARSSSVVPAPDGVPEPIAIIGCSGRFAGAETLDELWEHLLRGDDLVRTVDRWDLSQHIDGEHCNRGGLLREIDRFDPTFFNISGLEATNMDPQQRLFLEEAWKALEDAGYVGNAVDGRRAGVYVGCNSGDYRQLLRNAPAQAFWGNAASITPARVAYLLNLRGPAISIDTACSSSLVALHAACQGLWSRETDLALAGGVFVQSTPEFYVSSTRAGMLSRSGHSHTFDERADGFVPGEGVGVVVLKRLADAIADGDHIHAVIRGSGINQDGTTNGITAPSARSQEALETSVYERFRVHPEEIQFVEAHGTGTKLGDPIEVEALSRAFRARSSRAAYCAIGSIKANIGHAITAAGIAGLLKVVLALKHRTLPPSRHYRTQNPNIRLEGSPFFINTEPLAWSAPTDAPRCAVVSSFGFSGTNAHVVVQEAPPTIEASRAHDTTPRLIVLSARTAEQLKQQVARLHAYLGARAAVDLAALSHTLLEGRKHFEHRLAAIACSANELSAQLARFQEHGRAVGVETARLEEPAPTEQLALRKYGDHCIQEYLKSSSVDARREHLSVVGHLFTRGYELAYAALFAPDERRRIALPTYPFAKERYWVEGSATVRSELKVPAAPREEERADAQSSTGEWLYCREVWAPSERPSSINWKAHLERRGAQTVWVIAESESERTELVTLIDQLYGEASLPRRPRVVAVAPRALEDVELFRSKFPDAVLFLGAREMGGLTTSASDVQAAFLLSRGLMVADWSRTVAIHYVHEGSSAENRVYQEALSGFAAAAMKENSHHAWTVVTREPGATGPSKLQIALQEWLVNDERSAATIIRFRGELRERLRLIETELVPPSLRPFRRGGTYVIAGGFGPVGKVFCEKLAEVYEATLVVLSRAPRDSAIDTQCRRLEALGGRVFYRSVDINDRAALVQTMKELRRELSAIHGVIHLARLVDDDLIVNKDFARFARAARAKVDGTLNLDSATSDDALDFFVMFSSMAAFGIRGSADYGYSTAFQNAFARHRNTLVARGLRSGRTVSQCWGPWVVDRYMPPSRDARVSSLGLGLIDMQSAFSVVEASIARGEPVVGLMALGDRELARQQMHIEREEGTETESSPSAPTLDERIAVLEARREPSRDLARDELLELLLDQDIDALDPETVERIYALGFAGEVDEVTGPGPETTPAARDDDTRASAHAPAHPPLTTEALTHLIQETVANLLMVPRPGIHDSFQRYGMDSVGAVRLASSLGKQLGILVESRWLLDNSSSRALAEHLHRVMSANGALTNGAAAGTLHTPTLNGAAKGPA